MIEKEKSLESADGTSFPSPWFWIEIASTAFLQSKAIVNVSVVSLCVHPTNFCFYWTGINIPLW